MNYVCVCVCLCAFLWMHAVCECVCDAGVLVGNKSDLSERREVQTTVAQEWAQSQGLDYHETSAVSHARMHPRTHTIMRR